MIIGKDYVPYLGEIGQIHQKLQYVKVGKLSDVGAYPLHIKEDTLEKTIFDHTLIFDLG